MARKGRAKDCVVAGIAVQIDYPNIRAASDTLAAGIDFKSGPAREGAEHVRGAMMDDGMPGRGQVAREPYSDIQYAGI